MCHLKFKCRKGIEIEGVNNCNIDCEDMPDKENSNVRYNVLADGWREISNPPVRPDDYIIAVRLKRGGWGVYEQTYLGGEWMDNDKPDFWQPLPLPPNVS